jgi:ATP-dependent Clp protease adaptor protein ClpS
MSQILTDEEVKLAPRTVVKTAPARPPMFRVVMLNDDYTPMEFVVLVLMEVFHKSQSDAARIMLEVHQKGAGVCGIYTRDVAETKASVVIDRAQQSGYPLQCVVEPEAKEEPADGDAR